MKNKLKLVVTAVAIVVGMVLYKQVFDKHLEKKEKERRRDRRDRDFDDDDDLDNN